MNIQQLNEELVTTQIRRELNKMQIVGKVKINPDGSVDVDGDVKIPDASTVIPVKFRRVAGEFDCSYSEITSLAGSPSVIGADFLCEYTRIKSLVGGPLRVSRHFSCLCTEITSLAGAPHVIGGQFICRSTPHLFAVLPILKIVGITDIEHEAGEVLMRHYKPDGSGDIIACQDDLIDSGFAQYARMK